MNLKMFRSGVQRCEHFKPFLGLFLVFANEANPTQTFPKLNQLSLFLLVWYRV